MPATNICPYCKHDMGTLNSCSSQHEADRYCRERQMRGREAARQTVAAAVRVLTIDKDEGGFVVDDKNRSGSPPVGRGHTMKEALGDFFINNQDVLQVTFDVQPGAQVAEAARRKRAIKER